MNKYFLALTLVVTTFNPVQSSDVGKKVDVQINLGLVDTVAMVARGFDIAAKVMFVSGCACAMVYNEVMATHDHPERPGNPMHFDEKCARVLTYAAIPGAWALNRTNHENLACGAMALGAAASCCRHLMASTRTRDNGISRYGRY